MQEQTRKQKQLRIAVIDREKCINGKGCAFLCGSICPVNRAGKECVVLSEKKPVISEELCIGCGICVHKCPAHCIDVINVAGELQQPLHQYGENSFRLYKLFNPKRNAVVGLVGRNGIGKSTALEILSGNIVPNFGNFREIASYGEAIRFFRGKELQAFFEKLKQGKGGLSYKPQAVDLIPEKFKGKVEDLLKKVDEKNMLEEVAKQLEIDSILGHDIGKVSGGELQRIAIAAAFLKKASVYFFDEPSSYLDVRQRLRVGQMIRSLVNESTSVVVVEHDLALLDYLSDYVNVLYGKQSVYGVVSDTKSVLNGINEFLEGFLREENVRFREKELKFSVRPAHESVRRKQFAAYPALEKNFSGFSMRTEAGLLMKGEVIGILGPNAIGKTTFVKMLAGEEKPENTAIELPLKVAYKPQYIRPQKGVTVGQLFSKGIDKNIFESEVNRKLNIKNFFDRRLDKLSGGELQKVSIAYNLCLDFDLLLLDEPSAFIDVEDRLRVAELIRSVIDMKNRVALVVDHDILFQDYVADRLIVFSGQPARRGEASSPMEMRQGMNFFLKQMNVTFRRDPKTGRPRANKTDSQKDKEQKRNDAYYYA